MGVIEELMRVRCFGAEIPDIALGFKLSKAAWTKLNEGLMSLLSDDDRDWEGVAEETDAALAAGIGGFLTRERRQDQRWERLKHPWRHAGGRMLRAATEMINLLGFGLAGKAVATAGRVGARTLLGLGVLAAGNATLGFAGAVGEDWTSGRDADLRAAAQQSGLVFGMTLLFAGLGGAGRAARGKAPARVAEVVGDKLSPLLQRLNGLAGAARQRGTVFGRRTAEQLESLRKKIARRDRRKTPLWKKLMRSFWEDRKNFSASKDFFKRVNRALDVVFPRGKARTGAHGWSLEHMLLKRRWYAGAASREIAAWLAKRIGDVNTYRLLRMMQHLGDSGINTFPVPMGMNSWLYRNPVASAGFNVGTYAVGYGAVRGMHYVGEVAQEALIDALAPTPSLVELQLEGAQETLADE